MRAILTYHSVDRSGSVISVTPETFRAHVEWLSVGTVRVVSLAELVALSDEANAVALTFDDGLESVALEAAPLLAGNGLTATVFVVTGHVGRDNRWQGAGDPGIPVLPVLSWDALTRLQKQGFSIGSHTRAHRRLPGCSDGELTEELAGAAEDIARVLGERPVTFAYPYGAVDDRVAQAAAKQFEVGCTTEFKPVTRRTARHLVPRLDAWYFKDASLLRRWGTPSFRRALALRQGLRRAKRLLP